MNLMTLCRNWINLTFGFFPLSSVAIDLFEHLEDKLHDDELTIEGVLCEVCSCILPSKSSILISEMFGS